MSRSSLVNATPSLPYTGERAGAMRGTASNFIAPVVVHFVSCANDERSFGVPQDDKSERGYVKLSGWTSRPSPPSTREREFMPAPLPTRDPETARHSDAPAEPMPAHRVSPALPPPLPPLPLCARPA